MSADRTFEPGKLWSLWAVLEIDAESFVSAIDALAFARSTLRNSNSTFTGVVNAKNRKMSKVFLRTVAESCSALNANSSKREAEYLIGKLRGNNISFEEFLSLLEGLARLFINEIAGTKFLAFEKEKSGYYGQVSVIFGAMISTSFPDAEYDLEEAAKSLSLSRNTACVFHLMRAMEVIVSVVGDKLGVTILDKNDKALEWGKILANMSFPIEAMSRGAERTKWNAAHSMLYHVKEAWRNPTMHPSEKYTDEEAREILEAVKALIRHLVTLVDPWSAVTTGSGLVT